MESVQPSSLVYVQACELFPKKILKTDDSGLEIPFPELCGESVEYLSSTAEATLAISSYRLFICLKDNFINLPLQLIESLEIKELFSLHLNCKDGRSFRIVFDSNEQCIKWYQRLTEVTGPISRLEDLFSFTFHAWCLDAKSTTDEACTVLCQREDTPLYSFYSEYQRMGFDTIPQAWRITDINVNFEICPTYPKLHIVPSQVEDKELRKVADFRTLQRFPSIVWRHMTNGAVIARCSQPKVGWFSWRSQEDEGLLQALGAVCASSETTGSTAETREKLRAGPVDQSDVSSARDHEELGQQVLIVDARSYTAAFANRAKGGGCEYADYYPNCEVQFMNLANIHVIRKSFQSLRTLCSGPQDIPNWWSCVEKTNWLDHISLLLKATLTIVTAVHKERRPVVVHCSDGWDRTTQLVALAELILDPYYRTIEGFQVLVEREWLDFGHRFADRCGHGFDTDGNQRCPVFLQWLDCVHQLTRQFPCSFEFNEAFLLKLVQHTYSCLFGTFLCNSEKQRLATNIRPRTSSVWSLFRANRIEFTNWLYSPATGDQPQVLQPSSHVRSLQLWSAVYLAYPTPYCEAGSQPSRGTPAHARRLPVNYSDSNLELKHSGCSVRLSASRSDGELVVATQRCSQCRECAERRRTHAELRTCADRSHSDLPRAEVETHSATENITSLYYSTTSPCTDGIIFGVDSSTGSLTSSTNTLTDAERAVADSGQPLGSGAEHSQDTDVLEGLGTSEDTESCVCSGGGSGESGSASCKDAVTRQSVCEGQAAQVENPERETEAVAGNSSTASAAPTEAEAGSCTATFGYDSKCNDQVVQVENPGPQIELETRAETGNGPGTSGEHADCAAEAVGSASCSTLKPSFSQLLTRYMDIDGLTIVVDEVQERLRRAQAEHQLQLSQLRAQLLQERGRRLLCDQCSAASPASKTSDLADELFSLPDSSLSGEPPVSVSSTDESTWIEVEEKDAQPTLWVPDHAATNCANCDARFWIANRKHHCRNCGRVFCSSCSQQNLPVPDEQLYDPVRVCLACFEKLVSLQQRENGGRRLSEVSRS